MPLKDVVIAALSRPASRVVEAPVRELIDEALKDRGYASPAEIAQIREELSGLKSQIGALPARVSALEAQLVTLSGEAAALREALLRAEASASEARNLAAEAGERAMAAEARLAELLAAEPAAPALVAPAAAEPVSAAQPAPDCRCEGCGRAAVEHGFCRPHLLSWKAGRLSGFVSPEGLVDLDGAPARVAPELAGHPYRVEAGRVRVSGRFAAARPL